MTEGGGLFVQVGQAELLPRGRYAQIRRKPVVGERMRGGGAKALRRRVGLVCLRNRMKKAWRLMSKRDVVTHVSRKVEKSQILQGLVAHTEGLEFYAEHGGGHWKKIFFIMIC